MSHLKTIALHRDAPPKPRPGQPCNGCGVCCAAQPCPIGVFLLRQRRGPCRALRWQAERQRYVCGMLEEPRKYLIWLPRWLERGAIACFRRGIASGIGCDCDIELE